MKPGRSCVVLFFHATLHVFLFDSVSVQGHGGCSIYRGLIGKYWSSKMAADVEFLEEHH